MRGSFGNCSIPANSDTRCLETRRISASSATPTRSDPSGRDCSSSSWLHGFTAASARRNPVKPSWPRASSRARSAVARAFFGSGAVDPEVKANAGTVGRHARGAGEVRIERLRELEELLGLNPAPFGGQLQSHGPFLHRADDAHQTQAELRRRLQDPQTRLP